MADESPFHFLRALRVQTLRLFQGQFDWRITGRWMLYSAGVGVVGALAAVLLSNLIALLSASVLEPLAGYQPLPLGENLEVVQSFDWWAALVALHPWWLLVLPALGGLVSGLLVYGLAPEAEGSGTDAVIRAFHQEEGRIRKRVPFVKLLASAVVIGTGGSAGREGPIAQVSAGLGALLSDRLHLSARQRRILLVAGVAAGVGSIFRSPLGGAFFAVEVLYREDIETEALMPAVVAGITGYSVYSSIEQSATIFVTPAFAPLHPLGLLLVVAFALGCTVAGYLFMRFFRFMQSGVFGRMPGPRWLHPALGGLGVGAIAVFFPAVLGTSYGWLQQAIDGNLTIGVMGLLAAAKIASTSLTVGSGGSGGVFGPSLVVGGMLGGLFGTGMEQLFPALTLQSGAFVMIGMATFFAAVANVPVSTTIMISELTGRYTLLVPLIFGSVIAHLVSRTWGLYEHQVATHRDSPVHSVELATDLLSTVRVESIIERADHFHTLAPNHTLDEMLSVFTRTQEVILPVRPEDAEAEERQPFSGLVLLGDVQSLLQSDEMIHHLLIASDLEVPFKAVHLTDTLEAVLDTFVETGYPELPVLDADDEIAGFVRQGQVINEYHRAYLREKTAAEAVGSRER